MGRVIKAESRVQGCQSLSQVTLPCHSSEQRVAPHWICCRSAWWQQQHFSLCVCMVCAGHNSPSSMLLSSPAARQAVHCSGIVDMLLCVLWTCCYVLSLQCQVFPCTASPTAALWRGAAQFLLAMVGELWLTPGEPLYLKWQPLLQDLSEYLFQLLS